MRQAVLSRRTEAATAPAAKAASTGLRVGEPNDAFELEADRVAEEVMASSNAKPEWSLSKMRPAVSAQSEPGVRPLPLLIATPLTIQRQWSDAPQGPLGGARSAVAAAPSFGWNRGEVSVGNIRRIPVEGLSLGNPKKDPNAAAEEGAEGRAVVLIPDGIDLSKSVEVLLHLHGHNVGYRQRRTQGSHPSLQAGTVRDIDTDRIEQQLQASGRPMIGILPQGTTSSGFGGFNSDAYVAEVFRVLASMKAFGQNSAPKIARVVLSGHSGAGGPIAAMLSEPGQPRLPSSLGEVALFDAINGDGQLNTVQNWVLGRLNGDLAALTASGVTTAQQQSYLQTSLRFRAYYTSSSYTQRHVSLRQSIEAWFNQHASALGGKGSPLYVVLHNNYQVIAVGHGEHEIILSRGDKLQDALSALPPALPSPTSGSSAAAGASTSSASTSTAAPSSAAPSSAPPSGSLQRKEGRSGLVDDGAASLVEDALRSPGAPLDTAAQAFLYPRFQHDFRHVRVHNDPKAAASAQAVNAEAYTIGRDIVFGSGFYNPASARGMKLLAHELTHVVQQSGNAPLHGASLQRQATAETLNPIRADEQSNMPVSFNFGRFSIFVPLNVSLGSRGSGVDDLRVHVFFSAGAVQGNLGNDVLTHGLRGASAQSSWITIGVPSHTTISDQEIVDCLASIGINSPIKALRLSGHSRGAFSLMNSIVQKKITTLALIERVTLLDADDNPDPKDPNGATTTPKVEVLKRAGVDVSKITAYEVNVRKRHISGATYIGLDSGSMAAIGYVRLIRDAMVTQPGIEALVNGNAAIKQQLDSLPLPPRGAFTTGQPGPGQISLQAFSQLHQPEILAILKKDSTKTGLLTFINDNHLARFGSFKFDRGISAHHFFTAEVAHELTD